MRKLILLGGLLSCVVLVLGCPKKTDSGAVDAAAEAEAPPVAVVDAGAPAPVAVNAKNTADVARFPGETAVTDDDAKLGQLSPARTSPRSGSVVATLKPGGDVTKIAEYQGSVLVTFPDPKDANVTLMGWIGKEAFTAWVVRDGGVKSDAAVVDAGPAKDAGVKTCGAGQLAVVLATHPVCKKKCAKDAECKGGAAGSCVNANSVAGAVVRVCASD
jgi:hypothetical protein